MHALVLTAGWAGDPSSLDDARARRLLTPFLGAYASEDNVDRATVMVSEGALRMWQIEGDHQATPTVEMPCDLINDFTTSTEFNTSLGWHTVDRFVIFDGGDLMYSIQRRGWWRRFTEFWALRLTSDGVDLHHGRTFEYRGLLDPTSWFIDLNGPDASVLTVNSKLRLLKLSSRPIPPDEFARLARAPTATPKPPEPPRGQVIAFPRAPGKTCDQRLER